MKNKNIGFQINAEKEYSCLYHENLKKDIINNNLISDTKEFKSFLEFSKFICRKNPRIANILKLFFIVAHQKGEFQFFYFPDVNKILYGGKNEKMKFFSPTFNQDKDFETVFQDNKEVLKNFSINS